jgi:predicted adenine nucleotide alpha hydrolase (AANH) superfamily ATPase
MAIQVLRAQAIEVTGYWYNPNIHPYTEYQNRLNALKEYSKSIELPLLINDFYGLKMFTKMALEDLENRCLGCYELRLKETAIKAKEAGFDAFSTTLLISPYQKHEQLKITGERISNMIGIPFYYEDFRPYFREGQAKARALPLYMQKYCGCIFSEEERYLVKNK